jgi:methylated-DNA-[protein]-cysteine S-methyltransferase
MEATPIAHYYTEWDSPIGTLVLVANDWAIEVVLFKDEVKSGFDQGLYQFGRNAILELAITQLEDYFNGNRKVFELPIHQKGTDFQRQVWQTLLGIPYASTETYSQLAERLGDRNKIRAVATANAKNQLLIIVPCHRIIGENNKLVGYRGGLDRKRWLINFEKENSVCKIPNTLF